VGGGRERGEEGKGKGGRKGRREGREGEWDLAPLPQKKNPGAATALFIFGITRSKNRFQYFLVHGLLGKLDIDTSRL